MHLFILVALATSALGQSKCPRVPDCADGETQVMTNNCPSCREVNIACPTLTDCTSGPPTKGADGCLSCKCPTVSDCAEGVMPTRDATTQCKSCNAAVCPAVEICSPDEAQTKVDGCNSCRLCPEIQDCGEGETPGDGPCPRCIVMCIQGGPACADGVRPTLDLDGCPDCVMTTEVPCPSVSACAEDTRPGLDETGCANCTRVQCTKDQYEAIAECAADVEPERNAATGCPTCVAPPAYECTREEVSACLATDIRVCEDGERPEDVGDSCCKSCRISSTDVVCASDIEACARDKRPEMVDGCATCIFDSGTTIDSTCVLADCVKPRECAADEAPERINNCCQSCYVPKAGNTTATGGRCTDAQKEGCRLIYADLTECASDDLFVMNKTTCCYPCKKASLDVKGNGTSTTDDQATRCTKEAFAACTEAADVCLTGEDEKDRIYPDSSCCASCTRQERACDVEKVAKCKEAQKACADDEEPARISGECCGSCVRKVETAAPTCTTACGDKLLCARLKKKDDADKDDADETACVVSEKAEFTVTRPKAADEATCPTFTNNEARSMILEIMSRFCDKSINRARCVTLGRRIYNFVVETVAADADAVATDCGLDVALTIDAEEISLLNLTAIAIAPPAERRRRDGEEDHSATKTSVWDVFKGAMGDEEATSGFAKVEVAEIEESGSDSDSTTQSSGSGVVVAAGLTFVVAALF